LTDNKKKLHFGKIWKCQNGSNHHYWYN